MTSDEFDPRLLRRLDRPRRPAAPADERIRAAMLDAYDAEAGTAIDQRPPPDADAPPADIERTNHLELVPSDAATIEAAPLSGRPRGDRGTRWRFVLSAAAAVVVVVTIAAVLSVRSSEPSVPLDSIDPVDTDLVAVDEFCTFDVDPLVDVAGGEFPDRALRNLELLAQRYRDLAAGLSAEFGAAVAQTGDELLQLAADTRRDFDDNLDETVIDALALEVADAIESLPGSARCRVDALRGTTP